MSQTNPESLNVEQLHSHWLLAGEKGEACIIIDVRTPGEYAGGHVPSARLLPLDTLPARVEEIERRQTVFLICRSGMRSARAADYLAREHGYANLVNIDGGTMAWIHAGYPIEKE
jgi:rhodanese-related sulfurtransferase